MDLSAHELDQGRADGEAEAGTAIAPGDGGIGLDEPGEQAGPDRLVEADAGVLHGEAQVPSLAVDRHHHRAAVGELHRIADEIVQHLRQPVGISHMGLGQIVGEAGRDLHALGGRGDGQGLDHVLHQLADGEGLFLKADLPRLDLGEVQNVRHHPLDGHGTGADDVGIFPTGLGGLDLVEHVRHRHDAVQGRAELVTHVGEEPGLLLVGDLEFVGALTDPGLEGLEDLPVAGPFEGQAARQFADLVGPVVLREMPLRGGRVGIAAPPGQGLQRGHHLAAQQSEDQGRLQGRREQGQHQHAPGRLHGAEGDGLDRRDDQQVPAGTADVAIGHDGPVGIILHHAGGGARVPHPRDQPVQAQIALIALPFLHRDLAGNGDARMGHDLPRARDHHIVGVRQGMLDDAADKALHRRGGPQRADHVPAHVHRGDAGRHQALARGVIDHPLQARAAHGPLRIGGGPGHAADFLVGEAEVRRSRPAVIDQLVRATGAEDHHVLPRGEEIEVVRQGKAGVAVVVDHVHRRHEITLVLQGHVGPVMDEGPQAVDPVVPQGPHAVKEAVGTAPGSVLLQGKQPVELAVDRGVVEGCGQGQEVRPRGLVPPAQGLEGDALGIGLQRHVVPQVFLLPRHIP